MGDCHECNCFVNPPCGACENCKHWYVDDCPNDCQLCEYDHERTGPYRLADGTWSDGVDRSQPLVMSGFGSANEDRMTVFWMRHGSKFGVAAGNPETFPEFESFAEAIAYADRMARTNQGDVS